MYRHASQGPIRPKISTMPRQKSEPTAYLDTYKLVVEKKRLQEELQKLDQRRIQVQQRLEQLNQQITGLEEDIQQMRRDNPANAPEVPGAQAVELKDTGVQFAEMQFADEPFAEAENFETLLLDY
jgi:chromosome segregation ATPase